MTITKKEKVMIFVLIIFLLVGGIYVLGIMPKNNEITTLEESLATVQADIDAVDAQLATVSNTKYNQLLKEIEQNKAYLKEYADPENDIYEEVLPSNLPGHSDTFEIANTLNNFFGGLGMDISATIGSPSKTDTKLVYTMMSSYTTNRSTLYAVLDEVARIQSYNITLLTITNEDDDVVSGTLTMSITYVIAE